MIVTSRVFDEKSSDFFCKFVLVEISSKTRSLDEISKVGTHTPIKPDIANLFLHENAINFQDLRKLQQIDSGKIRFPRAKQQKLSRRA